MDQQRDHAEEAANKADAERENAIELLGQCLREKGYNGAEVAEILRKAGL